LENDNFGHVGNSSVNVSVIHGDNALSGAGEAQLLNLFIARRHNTAITFLSGQLLSSHLYSSFSSLYRPRLKDPPVRPSVRHMLVICYTTIEPVIT